MSIAIFIFYFLFFSFIVTRIRFFRECGLSKWALIGLFAVKVLAGLAYAYFYSLPSYKTNSDTFRFFALSLPETDWLLKDPIAFAKDIFSYGYNRPGNLFIGENSYWNDLKSNVIIKLLAICNVFTNKNYYANIVLFNFLFLFGIIAFYRLLSSLFTVNKWLLIIAIAGMPSFLFWCSGIHKDGLIFSALGLSFWYFYLLLERGFTIKRAVIVLLCVLLAFSLRNYISLCLVAVLFCWYLSHRHHNSWKPFVIVYLIGIALFFVSGQLDLPFNMPQYMVTKQQEFMQLNGGSSVALKKLEPSVRSFSSYLPSAIDMAMFRPHISEIKNKSYLPAIAEIIFLSILTMACIVFRKRGLKVTAPVYACLFFAITVLMIAGYTITFSGAIVRYRSLIIPFVAGPLICLLDFKKLSFFKKQ